MVGRRIDYVPIDPDHPEKRAGSGCFSVIPLGGIVVAMVALLTKTIRK